MLNLRTVVGRSDSHLDNSYYVATGTYLDFILGKRSLPGAENTSVAPWLRPGASCSLLPHFPHWSSPPTTPVGPPPRRLPPLPRASMVRRGEGGAEAVEEEGACRRQPPPPQTAPRGTPPPGGSGGGGDADGEARHGGGAAAARRRWPSARAAAWRLPWRRGAPRLRRPRLPWLGPPLTRRERLTRRMGEDW